MRVRYEFKVNSEKVTAVIDQMEVHRRPIEKLKEEENNMMNMSAFKFSRQEYANSEAKLVSKRHTPS